MTDIKREGWLYEVDAEIKRLLRAIDKFVWERHAPGEECGVSYSQMLAEPVRARILDAHKKYMHMIVARDEYEIAKRGANAAFEKFVEIMGKRFDDNGKPIDAKQDATAQ